MSVVVRPNQPPTIRVSSATGAVPIVTAPTQPVHVTVPTGKPGPPGPKGDDGTSVNIVGSVPSAPAGLPPTAAPGDGYISDDTGHLWVWNGTVWSDVGSIQGPPGRSPMIYHGDGTPTVIAGAQSGDMYIDDLTGDMYQLEYAAGSWTLG